MTGESCRLRTSDRLHSGLSGWGEYMRKNATKAIENSYLRPALPQSDH